MNEEELESIIDDCEVYEPPAADQGESPAPHDDPDWIPDQDPTMDPWVGDPDWEPGMALDPSLWQVLAPAEVPGEGSGIAELLERTGLDLGQDESQWLPINEAPPQP